MGVSAQDADWKGGAPFSVEGRALFLWKAATLNLAVPKRHQEMATFQSQNPSALLLGADYQNGWAYIIRSRHHLPTLAPRLWH